ncbi:MAG: hypothetical protein ABJF23_17180 [Bryobacteraceae bacterium]
MCHQAALLLFALAVPGLCQLTVTDPQFYRNNRERVDSYVFRTYTDPSRLSWLLFDSAVDHWYKSPCEWDRSAQSYGYRVASGWGRRIVRNTAQLGFETAFQEDSRYRVSGERRFGRRILFAINHSVLAYRPDGSVGPMYGRMAAGVIADATASTWHPRSTTAGSFMGGIGQSAIDRAGNNLLTEFEPDLKRFGLRVWRGIAGKPKTP